MLNVRMCRPIMEKPDEIKSVYFLASHIGTRYVVKIMHTANNLCATLNMLYRKKHVKEQ